MRRIVKEPYCLERPARLSSLLALDRTARIKGMQNNPRRSWREKAATALANAYFLSPIVIFLLALGVGLFYAVRLMVTEP